MSASEARRSAGESGVPTLKPNAWVERHFDVLCENVSAIRRVLTPGTEVVLVVKANAYGHGMQDVGRHAWACGVRWFVVAHLDEAVALRAVLPEARILILGAVWADAFDVCAEGNLTPVLVSPVQGAELAVAARRRGRTLRCHAKIDTGMGRLGFDWAEAPERLIELARAGGLEFEGVCTHFASAGKVGDVFPQLQRERFHTVVDKARAGGLALPFRHVSNSAAFSVSPEWDLEGVRTGILAYGYGGMKKGARSQTRPFLEWKTCVAQVKRVPAGFPVGYLSTYTTPSETCLATIAVGYADGFNRLLSNQGCVLIRGRRCPVVGRVSMNFSTVDVGLDSGVREHDEVVLIGRQGGETLWADELARWCRTIPYEILTSIRCPPRDVPAGR